MGRAASPLLNKRYGCYTVAERVMLDVKHPSHQRSHWRVVCDCGFTKVVSGQNLVRDFPLKCNHVPEGHRVIGPKEIAVLDALLKAKPWELQLFISQDNEGSWTHETARAELARRSVKICE